MTEMLLTHIKVLKKNSLSSEFEYHNHNKWGGGENA
jgi:hypothetical protein